MYAHNGANRSAMMKNTSKCLLPGPLPTPDRYLQAAHIPSQYLYSLSLRHLYEWYFLTKWNYFSRQVIGNIFAGYIQQDATFHNLFISVRRSTYFRRFFRPSSGAQNCTYWSDKYLTLCVQFWAPDGGRGNLLKQVERLTEIKKLWTLHVVGYTLRKY